MSDAHSSMKAAMAEASKAAQAGEIPVGAIIVHERRIIARAHNQVEQLSDATAHAEMIALTQAAEAMGGWRLDGTTLYVTLEPCTMCIGAVLLARVGRVVFGASDPVAGACGSVLGLTDGTGLPRQVPTEGGVLGEECSAMLKEFFRRLRT